MLRRRAAGAVAGWNALVLVAGLVAAASYGTPALDVATGGGEALPAPSTTAAPAETSSTSTTSSSTTTSTSTTAAPTTTAPPRPVTSAPTIEDSHGPTDTVVEGDGSPLPPGTIVAGDVSFSGVVHDEQGQPVAGMCIDAGYPWGDDVRAVTGSDGAFSFTSWSVGYEPDPPMARVGFHDCSARWPGFARGFASAPGGYSMPAVFDITVTPGVGVIAPLAPNHGPGAPDPSMAGGCLVIQDEMGPVEVVIDPTGTLVAGGLVPGYVDLVGACTPHWAVQREGPGMPYREPIPPGGVATRTDWFVTPPGSLG